MSETTSGSGASPTATTPTAAGTGYTPGSWFGIVGSGAVVLLPPSEKERAGALWSLVDEGAGFEEVLDALVSAGLRSLPGFVLVATDDSTTRVVVRGAHTASFETAEGPVEVDGSGSATWVERRLEGVTRMVVQVEESDAEAYVLTGGLVRVAGIEAPPAGGSGSLAAPEVAPSTVAFTPVEVADAEGEAADDEAPDDEAPEVAAEPAAPAVPPPPPAEPAWSTPPPPPPPAPFATDHTGEGSLDHDGLTRDGVPSPDLARQQPGIPGQPSAPAVTAYPVARLEFSSGDRVDVDRVVLVGRAPEAGRLTQADQPLLVTVPSPNQEISSTHCEVRPGTGVDHGAAVVTDLGSTNGTVLVQPGLGPEELRPGVPVQLMPGAVIDLGDGLTIRVSSL